MQVLELFGWTLVALGALGGLEYACRTAVGDDIEDLLEEIHDE